MSEHPLDVLREALEDYWANHEPVTSNLGGRSLAALRAVEQLEQAAREFVDFAGDDAERAIANLGVPQSDFERDVAKASRLALELRAALAPFDRKEQT